MTKLIQVLFLSCLSFFCGKTATAQGLKDPTKWTYTVKKIAADEYQLNFILQLEAGWHIWALEAGGDGTQISPSFTFDDNSQATVNDDLKETGKLTSETMEGVEGTVNFYSGKVTYSQTVKAPAGTTIKGTHQYQVCNDKLCMPPKDVPFSLLLK